MQITGFDHIVLSVNHVASSVAFYRDLLGMEAREERPGKWSLYFGSAKISLQDEAAKPEMAARTLPGTGNFCVLSDLPVGQVAERLRDAGVEILEGPAEKSGATGPILSVYFRDPDGTTLELMQNCSEPAE